MTITSHTADDGDLVWLLTLGVTQRWFSTRGEAALWARTYGGLP